MHRFYEAKDKLTGACSELPEPAYRVQEVAGLAMGREGSCQLEQLTMSLRTVFVTAAAAAGLSVSCGVLAQGTITNLGVVSGQTTSFGHSVSADGSTASGASGTHPFIWTAAGGLQDLGIPSGGTSATAYGVSGDGANAVVTGNTGGVFRWNISTGYQSVTLPIGSLGGFATGISDDGAAIVGSSVGIGMVSGFIWTSATGPVVLGFLPGGNATQPFAVNDDGSVVVGLATTATAPHPFRWTAATGVQSLGFLPGGTGGQANDVTPDGSVIVGTSGSPPGYHAFRWTMAGGMEDLGLLPASLQTTALGVTADGAIVVGRSDTVGGGAVAMIWTSATGMMDLNVYLTGLGIDLTGWNLTQARSISADGCVMAGVGTFEGAQRGWVMTLPPPGEEEDDDCGGNQG